jgi:hypothetical protein
MCLVDIGELSPCQAVRGLRCTQTAVATSDEIASLRHVRFAA